MKGLAAAAQAQSNMAPNPELDSEMPMSEGNEFTAGEAVDLDDTEEQDAQIGFGLAANALFEEDGIQGINEAFNQQNPVPIVANMLATLVKELAQGTQGTEIELSPRIWLAEEGVVERLLDLVGEISGIELDDQMRNAIFSDVVDQIKLMGKAEEAKGQMPPEQGMGGGQPPMPMMGGMA